MGIKRPVDFRFPEREVSYTQGGNHATTVQDVWQTAVTKSSGRGTLMIRQMTTVAANYFMYIRVTIDGVEYPIQGQIKCGLDPFWILDFNLSFKIEHQSQGGFGYSRVEWAYHEYTP